MVESIGPAGAYDGQVVRAGGSVRQPIADFQAALTVTFEAAAYWRAACCPAPIGVMTVPKLAGNRRPFRRVNSGLGSNVSR